MKEPNEKEVFNTLIVEDEPICIEQLSQYIAQVNFLTPPKIGVDGITALQILDKSPVDILFLDLSLPDMGGLDLLKALPHRPAVIVTSLYNEWAIDCYDMNVIDFLPKPYDFNRFLRGISRVLKHTSLASFIDAKPAPTQDKGEIYFKSGRRLERFTYNDILYIEAYGMYTKIHTFDGVFAINKRISTLIQELPETRFIRIHKSYIINIDHLKRLESKQLWIKSNKLPIGITYQPIVHEKLRKLGVSATIN